MANKLYPFSFSARQALYVMVSGPYSLEMTEELTLSPWLSVTGSMVEVKKTTIPTQSLTGQLTSLSGELRPARQEINCLEDLGWSDMSVSGVLRPAYVEITGPAEDLTGWLSSSIAGVLKLAATSMEMATHSLLGQFQSVDGEFFVSAKFGIQEDLQLSGMGVSGNLRPGYLAVTDSDADLASLGMSLDSVYGSLAQKLLTVDAMVDSLVASAISVSGQMYSPVVDVDSGDTLKLSSVTVTGSMAVKVHQVQDTPSFTTSSLSLDGVFRSTIVYVDANEGLTQSPITVSGSLQEMLRKVSSTPDSLISSLSSVTGDMVLKQKSVDSLESITPSISLSGVFRENISFVDSTDECRLSGVNVSGVFSLDPGLRVVLFDTLKTDPGPSSLVVSFTNLKD